MSRDELPRVIETPRLRLRPWELGDVHDVLAYAADPEWSRYLRALPSPYGLSDAERFVARQVLLDWVEHPAWAILLEETVIGGVNLRFRFEHRLAELGYAVARAQWNRGFATEVAAAVIDRAFRTHADLNRIFARADRENRASQRVLEKVGMAPEGVLRQARVERGEAIDEAWYGVLRREWREAPDV